MERHILAFISFTILHCHSSQLDTPQDARTESRFISLSTGPKIYGELLVSLPLTIFLPSLVMKRSLETWDRDPDGVQDQQSTVLENILETLGAETLDCQKRLICDVISKPKTYQPISDIIYLILRNESISDIKANQGKVNVEMYHHYRQGFVAGRHAFTAATTTANSNSTVNSDPCRQSFPLCDVKGETAEKLDFKILKYWQKISDFIPLTITV